MYYAQKSLHLNWDLHINTKSSCNIKNFTLKPWPGDKNPTELVENLYYHIRDSTCIKTIWSN